MLPLLRPFITLGMAACRLLGPAAWAQSARFTSYAQFNDILVARFNRADLQGLASLSSPVLRESEPAGSRSRFWLAWQAKTGRILSSAALEVRGQRHEFVWKGEKLHLRVVLLSPTPGVLNDYTLSDFIAQPTGRPTSVLTDNKQKTPLDQAVQRTALLYLQHPDADRVGRIPHSGVIEAGYFN